MKFPTFPSCAVPHAPISRGRAYFATFLLIAAVLVMYGRAGSYEFLNMDDDIFISNNPYVSSGLTWKGIHWGFFADLTFNSRYLDYWQPMTIFSRLIDAQLYGLWAGGHHLTNVILHAANAALLFLILLRMTSAFWRSAFVAALFAFGPLQVEAVAWISARKDLLSTFFALLTIAAYVDGVSKSSRLRFVRLRRRLLEEMNASSASPSAKVRCRRTLLFCVGRILRSSAEKDGAKENLKVLRACPRGSIPALLFFILALAAKPAFVSLPFILLLIDYWPLERFVSSSPSRRRVLWNLTAEKWPFWLVSAVWYLTTSVARTEVFSRETWSFQAAAIPVNYIHYFTRWFYPEPFGLQAPLAPHAVTQLQVMIAVCALAVITAFVIWAGKRFPYLVAGWFWFLLALAPSVGLLEADRYAYFSFAGISIMVAWSAWAWSEKWPLFRRPIVLIASGFVLASVLWTHFQLGYWKNNITLFTHFVESNPQHYRAHNNLGAAYAYEGNTEQAIEHFTKALSIFPYLAEAHSNLSVVLARSGAWQVAAYHARRAVEIHPTNASFHLNLGTIFLNQGNVDGAIAEYRRSVEAQPDFALGYDFLGNALVSKGEVEEGISNIRKSIEINPGLVSGHYDLALALSQEGRYEEAIRHFRGALKIDPSLEGVRGKLGAALAGEGKWTEAEQVLRRALLINPDDEDARHNLELLLEDAKKGSPQARKLVII